MDSNAKETKEILTRVIDHITCKLPDARKAAEKLWKFAEMNQGRIFSLFKIILDPQTDYKNVIKYNKEIKNRLEKYTGVLEIVSIFLRRISMTLVNKESMQTLIKYVQDARQGDIEGCRGETSERLLKDVSRLFPQLYKPQSKKLCELIMEGDLDLGNYNLTLVTDSLEALSKFVKVSPEEFPKDSYKYD